MEQFFNELSSFLGKVELFSRKYSPPIYPGKKYQFVVSQIYQIVEQNGVLMRPRIKGWGIWSGCRSRFTAIASGASGRHLGSQFPAALNIPTTPVFCRKLQRKLEFLPSVVSAGTLRPSRIETKRKRLAGKEGDWNCFSSLKGLKCWPHVVVHEESKMWKNSEKYKVVLNSIMGFICCA